MSNERYVVVQSFTTSDSDQHYDDEDNLTEVTLQVAGGPYGNLRDAQQIAMTNEDEYLVVAITPSENDE